MFASADSNVTANTLLHSGKDLNQDGHQQIRITAACAAALLVASAAACSKNASGGPRTPAAGTSGSSGSSAPPALAGSVTFNQDNLAKLDAALKSALAGKDLSGVNIAMVVNVAADYWKAGQVGFQKGCSDLGLSGSNCTYFAPPNGKLTEQNSEMETLRSQGITGYAISAIDPTSAAGTIHTDVQHGISGPGDRLPAARHRRRLALPRHPELHRRASRPARR